MPCITVRAALARIAQRVHRLTGVLAAGLKQMGAVVDNRSWFDTLTIATGARTEAVHANALARGINLRRIDERPRRRIARRNHDRSGGGAAVAGFRALPARSPRISTRSNAAWAKPARRRSGARSSYLQHPVFNAHHSETAMLRYMRELADRDLALDRTMIPLGSCTMKLNATSEMLPITWPEFAQIHPFAPAAQTAGYRELIDALERMLCAITGYAAVSLQPNAGSQGEFAACW